MPKKGANISLSSYDDIFETDASRAEAKQERIQSISILDLVPFELLSLKDVLLPFKKSLMIDKKTKAFRIHDEKARSIYRPIMKDIIIDSLRESEKGLSQKEIMEELRFRLHDESIVKSQYVSGILQTMKKSGLIYGVKERNKTIWFLEENSDQ